MIFRSNGEAMEEIVQNSEPMFIYCAFCEGGAENQVAFMLEGSKICNALIPQIEKDERRQGVWRRVRHNMLPGYVFLFSDCQLDCAELSRLSGVIKILGYDTGDHALHGSDREFAVWLYRNSGCIGVSTAVAEGSRIRVTGGPLLDYAGCIKEVNRSKRIAKVAVSVDDVIRDVWMSFEWLE